MNVQRDASGRLTAAVDAAADAHEELTRRVVERFRLVAASAGAGSPDAATRDCSDGAQRVSLDRDVCMGFHGIACTPAAEPLVEAIANFLAGPCE